MYLDLIHYDEKESIPLELESFLEGNFHSIPPFSPVVINFCQQLSYKLAACQDPDTAGLGFWLRPAHIHELHQRFFAGTLKGSVRTPRGLAFHISASNVDTLFAYSWILSMLMGNGNIIRLPTKQSDAIKTILHHIFSLLEDEQYLPIEAATCLIRYGHQKKINAAISTRVALRLIWGSNQTIEAIRAFPLNPYGKEIVFPDRFSYAAIEALAYAEMNEIEKHQIAVAFFRDAYGFDQHGCSCPRLIFWVGQAQAVAACADEFYHRLKLEIERREYFLALSDILQKQAMLYALCATTPVSSVHQINNELTIVKLTEESSIIRKHPGAGLFYQLTLKELNDIEHHVAPEDQTLTYAGFNPEIIEIVAKRLNGRGPKRFVPFGEALHFSAAWDGYDLMQELTNCMSVPATTFTNTISR